MAFGFNSAIETKNDPYNYQGHYAISVLNGPLDAPTDSLFEVRLASQIPDNGRFVVDL